jgi:hypothetical protein
MPTRRFDLAQRRQIIRIYGVRNQLKGPVRRTIIAWTAIGKQCDLATLLLQNQHGY